MRNNVKLIFVMQANESTSNALHLITSGNASYYKFKSMLNGCRLGRSVLIDRNLGAEKELVYVSFQKSPKFTLKI